MGMPRSQLPSECWKETMPILVSLCYTPLYTMEHIIHYANIHLQYLLLMLHQTPLCTLHLEAKASKMTIRKIH